MAKSTGKDLFTTFGVPGEAIISGFQNEERRVDDLTINDYRRMKDNDGEIQMLLNAIYNTILSAGTEVVDDPDYLKSAGDNPESSEEKVFIERNIYQPYWKGGMYYSLEKTNRVILRALEEGYRAFEVLYRKPNADGKIYLDKLCPRAGKRDGEFVLLTDDNGNFNGFHQITSLRDSYIDVFVRNDSVIKKVVKATYGEEYGSLYGRSALKAAWYHYDKAHKAYHLNHVGHEKGAIKLANVKILTNNENTISNFKNILQRLGMEAALLYNQGDFEVTFEDVSDAGVMAVGLDMAKLHMSMAAKSLLAQFIDLGSNTSNTGSRSLGDSQMDFFKVGLQSIATILIENTWNEVIADLVKINFDRGIYPSLKVKPIADNTVEFLMNTFMEVVKKGELTDSIKTEILNKGSNKLNFNVTKEQIQDELEADLQKSDKEKSDQLELQRTKMSQVVQAPALKIKASENQNGLQEISSSVDQDLPYRELYPDEQKVRLAEIKRKLINTEVQAEMALREVLGTVRDQIVNQYIQASREGRKSLGTVQVKLQESRPYTNSLITIALELLDFGKVKAANEIGVGVPVTTKGDINIVTDKVNSVVEDQTVRIKLRLQLVAQNALEGNVPENTLRVLLENEFDNFFTSIIPPTVGSIIPESLNRGRRITFDKYNDKIFAFRYTAVIDNRTTTYCRSLDGRVFQSNDPEFVMVTPPNHFGCRSIWTPITKVEQSQSPVDVTGKQSQLPLFGSISSFKDIKSVQANEAEIDKQIEILLSQ